MSVPLPADTSLAQSFEWGLDINLGTTGSPSWQPIRRISAWQPSYPPVTQDAATYDDFGAENTDVTGRSFSASFTVQGNQSDTTGLYLPELEKLLAADRSIGAAAVVEVRWYNKPVTGVPNPNGAGRAFATVAVTRQNTGNADIEVYSVTLTGKGKFTPITNPFTGWGATAPVLASITPAAATTGDLVTLSGSGFLGATDVKFGTPSSPEILVVNAATIIAQLPTGSAGSVNVTVITPGGTSNAVAYTRGA